MSERRNAHFLELVNCQADSCAKKRTVPFFLFPVWIALVALVVGSLSADPPATYYDAATGLTGGPLKQALHGVIANQTVIPYANILGPLAVIWRDPANSANIILTYSDTSVPATSTWNREHLWPRSRGNSDQVGPDDSDLFHVVPTDNSVNAERASLYFDESDPGDPNYRLPAHALAPQTSRDSDSWQPPPQERGDIARALFYMDVRYDGQEAQTTDMELVSFPPTGSQMGRLNTLLLWNEQDPPDDAERARNDLIYTTYQHNRNPFIDHPEWVAAIWGTGVPNTPGNKPIARVELVASSAVESPQAAASFQVLLNQFAGTGGVAVTFTMSGTASLSEYTLSGTGLTYDPATGIGTVLIPENFSSALVRLLPVSDGVTEPAETAVATLNADTAYTVVPGATALATVTITDAPRLPATWNFNTASYANPMAANSGGGSISFTGWHGTLNYFTGYSGSSLALIGNGGNGTWLDINLSMAGYTDLALSFWTRGTSAGFSTGTWSASADGVTFTTLSGVNTATTGTNFVQRTVSFASLGELTDAPNVTLRYTLSGATSSTGNNRIDELTLTATPAATGNALRTVSIVAADSTANELGPTTGAYSVQLNGLAPVGGLDVVLAFTDGTTTAPDLPGADYTLTGVTGYDAVTRTGHVFFPEGQRTALVTLTPIVDSVLDNGETAIATVVDSANYLISTYRSAIITISEPVLSVYIYATDASAGESPLSTGTFSVQLSGPAPASGLDVRLSFANGTATAPELPGADYTLAGLTSYDSATRTGHLIFAEGQQTALLTVTPIVDDVADSPETVAASIVSSSTYAIGSSSATVTIAEPSVNDNFSAALPLTGTSATTTGNNVGATYETGEPSLSGGQHSLWWNWQATANGIVKIDTQGSNFDTYLGVYTGPTVNALTRLGSDDDGGEGVTSLLNLRAVAGTIYRIKVEGFSTETGNIVLNVNFTPNPTVSISPIISAAKERGNVRAQVRVTLFPGVVLATPIALNFSGTAQINTDYQSSTVPTIAAGATTADIYLTPLTDTNTIEQTETIVVQIADSTAYTTVSAPLNSTTLTIEDDSPYSAAWLNGHPGLTPQDAVPTSDRDDDGLPALLEYITGHDPLRADGESLMSISPEVFIDPADHLEKTFAAIRFRRRTDAANIPLTLEISDALGSWLPGGLFISATPVGGTPYEILLFRSTTPLPDGNANFFRCEPRCRSERLLADEGIPG